MNSGDSRNTLNHVFSLSGTTGKIIPILIQFRFQAFLSIFLWQESGSLSGLTGGKVLLTFSWSFPFLAHPRVAPVPFAVHNPLPLLVFFILQLFAGYWPAIFKSFLGTTRGLNCLVQNIQLQPNVSGLFLSRTKTKTNLNFVSYLSSRSGPVHQSQLCYHPALSGV